MGNCGGPLDERLVQIEEYQDLGDGVWEGARKRPDGVVEISGSVVMRPSAGMEGVSFTSCPVAEVDFGAWVGGAFERYRAWDAGQLALVEPEPSAALLQTVDLVGMTFGEVRKYEAEARKRNRKPKA